MDAEQAVAIARRWQEFSRWLELNKAVANFRLYSEQAAAEDAFIVGCERRIEALKSALSGRLPKEERQGLKADLARKEAYRKGEAYRLFEHSQARHEELAESEHSHALQLLAELQTLEDYIREHSPELLEHIPPVNPWVEPANAADGVQMMRRLESGLLSEQGKQPEHATLATAQQFADDEYTEPLPKSFVAEVVFDKSTDWLSDQVSGGSIVAITTKKKIRVHVDAMPKLKRMHERTTALAEWNKNRRPER